MSQYANALAGRYPLTTAYYHRTGPANSTDGNSVMPMAFTPTQGAAHQSQDWPQYYAEHHSLPQAAHFNTSYASSSCPSPSSSLCAPYSDVTATVPSLGASGNVPRFVQDSHSFIDDARPLQYASSGQSLSVQDYPTSSQRTNMEPSPPPQLVPFLPVYGFKENRTTSSSPPTSVSDYECAANWESSGQSQERVHYPPSCRDGSPEDPVPQITEATTRYSSLPASTTTDISTETSVKMEPDDPDGCFIMELPSFQDVPEESAAYSASAQSSYKIGRSVAPPTEVPLRATQASKEMRGMMGVFRLNPFAMHSLSVGGAEGIDGQSGLGCDGGKTQASWCGEAGPLEEEPVILEFQLNIEGIEVDGEEISPSVTIGKEDVDLPVGNLRIHDGHVLVNDERLRSFSPSFELHSEDIGSDFESHNHSRDQSTSHYSQERDYETDLENESWRDGDYSRRSEVDTSSTTTRSVHTPLYDSPEAPQPQVNELYDPGHEKERPPSSSAWHVIGEQYMGDRFPSSRPSSSSGMPYVQSSVRYPKLHTTTSHPYLRKSQPNHPTAHGHSQSFSHTQSHNLSYVPQLAQADASFPTPHTENNAHISSQYVQNHHRQRHFDHNHVPSYAVPVVGSNHIVDNVQNLPGSTSYMRKVNRLESWPKTRHQRLRNEEHEYEQHGHDSSPSGTSSPSNEAYMYAPSTEASMQTAASAHAVMHARAMNLASNRRWSLPETGQSSGHGVGHGGSFLSFM